jgi:hypothetical protein
MQLKQQSGVARGKQAAHACQRLQQLVHEGPEEPWRFGEAGGTMGAALGAPPFRCHY